MRFSILTFLLFSISSWGQSIIEKSKSLYESKKFEEAKAILKNIDDDNKDYAAAQFWLGRIAFDQKEYEDASEYFEEATESNNKSSEYFTWLGDTYATIAQDANMVRQGILATKMKAAWEQAIALDANNLNARRSLIQFYLQAPGFMGGSVEKAIEVANQIKRIKPAEGHRQLGNIYVNQKKISEAEVEYIAMTKADPMLNSVLVNFYSNQKQFDKAMNLAATMLKNEPNNMAFVYLFGRTSAVSGKEMDKGEECLKKYLTYTPKSNEPSHAGAYMRLGNIYEKKGNKSEAKKNYESALKLQSDLKEAKEGLDRIN